MMSFQYFVLLFFIWLQPNQPKNSFTDVRDGQQYQSIQIGQQNWMAENLKYRIEGSTCYDNHPFPCRRYGRLYVWESLEFACPEGWRVPTDKDWNRLYRYLGNNSIDAYAALIKSGDSGFNAQFGGWLTQNETFQHAGTRGYFWSATEKNDESARYYRLDKVNKAMTRDATEKTIGFSCRCIKETD